MIEIPSGRWSGYYRYGWLLLKRKGSMQLELAFQDGVVKGGGLDPVGSFTITGSYGVDCQFTKQYDGKHLVLYRGTFDGKCLSGRWKIPYNWGGDFKIWPGETEGGGYTGLLGIPVP